MILFQTSHLILLNQSKDKVLPLLNNQTTSSISSSSTIKESQECNKSYMKSSQIELITLHFHNKEEKKI